MFTGPVDRLAGGADAALRLSGLSARFARLGLRALALAIRGYRRFASGRGPLRRVTCSFHGSESCSAYGLRVAETIATRPGQALALIGQRLRACGDVALVRFPDSATAPRGALAWGDLHDQPITEVARGLAAAGELPGSCALVMASRAAVARWRGDGVDLGRCRRALTRLAVPTPTLVVRNGPRTLTWLRRRVATRLGLGVALALLAALALPAFAAVIAGLAAAAVTAVTTARPRRRLQRYRRQLQVAGTSRPGWPPSLPNATTRLATAGST